MNILYCLDPILIDHTLTLNFMQGYDVLVSLVSVFSYIKIVNFSKLIIKDN